MLLVQVLNICLRVTEAPDFGGQDLVEILSLRGEVWFELGLVEANPLFGLRVIDVWLGRSLTKRLLLNYCMRIAFQSHIDVLESHHLRYFEGADDVDIIYVAVRRLTLAQYFAADFIHLLQTR